MKGILLIALGIATLLFIGAKSLETMDSGDEDQTGPQGASDGMDASSVIWLVLASVGFVAFALVGLLWRRRQRSR